MVQYKVPLYRLEAWASLGEAAGEGKPMIATVEADGLLIRMDSQMQTAHIVQVFPSGGWGRIEEFTLRDIIVACKTIRARKGISA